VLNAATRQAGGGREALARKRIVTAEARLDVTDAITAVAAGITSVEERARSILVNNAAMNQRKPPGNSRRKMAGADGGESRRPVSVTERCAAMKARRAARSSMSARSRLTLTTHIVPYAASKGALRMLTRALAVELAPSNIQVNGISPGFFKTEMNAPLIKDAEFSAWVARRTPAGRWGDPPEIAGAAVFLVSSAADYVTGHVLYVDGGFSAAY
jgi:gluconate 5-dehydrogenase